MPNFGSITVDNNDTAAAITSITSHQNQGTGAAHMVDRDEASRLLEIDTQGEAKTEVSNSSSSNNSSNSSSSQVGIRCVKARKSQCRYKGVVPQQNGNWGAQIYANHQRIWLGTFKTERDAAMAYDSAAIRHRSSDPYRNIPLSPSMVLQETEFQTRFDNETLLNMIKEGSYQSKLADFCASQHQRDRNPVGVAGEAMECTELFEKELTPSDVGKLNRLVIPKKYALKFLPPVNDGEETKVGFFDRAMKCWKFRYCYWKSSQSYVFTRGWNKFVKEKGLKAKDVVVFSHCRESNIHMVDLRLKEVKIGVAEVEEPPEGGKEEEESKEEESKEDEERKEEESKEVEERKEEGSKGVEERKEEERKEEESKEVEERKEEESKVVRLFGVEINR